MSVEAIAYVKSLDLGDCEKARLLMYVIGENTFNDTFVCLVGIDELAYQTRVNEKTVRRQLAILAAREAEDGTRRHPIVIRQARRPSTGGRLHDAIRIVGFKAWYLKNYGSAKRSHKSKNAPEKGSNNVKTQPGKMSGRPQGQAGKMSGSGNGLLVSGVGGQQVSVTKESRTIPVLSEDAHSSAREDSIFDLKVKTLRDGLDRELGRKVFEAWFTSVAFDCAGSKLVASTGLKPVRNWIRDHYEALILRVAKSIWPEVIHVDFVLTSGAQA